MINVFISYCDEIDGDIANKLKSSLEELSDIEIEVNMVAIIPSDTEETANKIARFLDLAHYFIILYTTDKKTESRDGEEGITAKENIWVNQELGYAFNSLKEGLLKIIPVYTDMEDFKGFLTSRTHNIHRGFKLEDRSEKGEDKLIEEISKYFTEEHKHPVTLNIEKTDFNEDVGGYRFQLLFSIDNGSSKILRDSALHFIAPTNASISLWTTPPIIKKDVFDMVELRKIMRPLYHHDSEMLTNAMIGKAIKSYELESKVIPSKIKNRFVSDLPIKKITYLLDPLLGENEYEIEIFIHWPKKLGRTLNLGTYFQTPHFGNNYYQLGLDPTTEGVFIHQQNTKESPIHISSLR